MSLIIFSLTCLLLTNFFIQSTTYAVPTNIENLEFDDITSLWDKFPSIIDKVKDTVNRFRCPKGWKRLGGSCYYLSNLISTSTNVNYTCNFLHSNLSNLIQIRNAVELFYATHVLLRNNWSSLMIDIHPNLLKGKKISEMLMNDEGRWERMKGKFREARVKYQKFAQKIVNRLNSTGLRILRRSKKIKQIPPKQKFIHDEFNPDQYDEYEYDDLDSSDESDEFEQIQDIRGICQKIDWNVLNNNSTVFILTTYIVSDKIVCSLSDVDPNTEYHYICEYVLDFCFANIVCGKHGQCVNTLTGFKCSCTFLFGGLLCEKITKQGLQIIIGFVLIIIFKAILTKWIQGFLLFIVKFLIKKCRKALTRKNENTKKEVDINNQEQQPLHRIQSNQDNNDNNNQPLTIEVTDEQQRHDIIFKKIRVPHPLTSPIKHNLVRNIWVAGLSLFIFILLSFTIILRYYKLFKIDTDSDRELDVLRNHTIRLVKQCEHIYDYESGNLIFFPVAFSLILIFCCLNKRRRLCLHTCNSRCGLIPPIEPFSTRNRLTTATVFAVLAYEVLKIFEELLFGSRQISNHGVLFDLFIRIAIIVLAGLRYYPVLASLHLYDVIARFLVCLYIICDIVYTIVREGSCIGFLPLSERYTLLEEAKLRMELGTWFLIYGLIKYTPHFFFLSYITAELCVRFAYDSIYVQLKQKRSIRSVPNEPSDESEFAQYRVTKLLRPKRPSSRTTTQQNININNQIDYEHEAEQQNKPKQSRLKKIIKFIYHSDDDFRFTTMVTCTYTIAIVSLYYLACTFVFLYLSRPRHISFIKFYVESTFNIDLGASSLMLEIIVSVVLTVIIYGFQLFFGIKAYKRHKLKLCKGICVEIPQRDEFDPNSIATNSVHYSGLLVGYMAWGFVICSHLILFILIGIRILFLQIRYIEIALGIIVPVLVIYLLKEVSVTSAGQFLFIQEVDKPLNLKNKRAYAVFVYFNFFADCFLGIASCVIRLMEAMFFHMISMARLDYSFLGQPFGKLDSAYVAYVSYLYMEIKHTHSVKNAFCYSLLNTIQKRPRKYYDEECCTTLHELHGNDIFEEHKENQFQQNTTNPSSKIRKRNKIGESPPNINHNVHEFQSKRIPDTSLRLQENDSPSVLTHKNKSTEVKYKKTDDEVSLPTREIMPQTKSQNSFTTTDKDSQMNDDKKSKQQTSNIFNNAVKIDENGTSSTSHISSISQQQRQLSKSRANAIKASTSQSPASKQDQSDDESYDDDGGLNLKKIKKQKQNEEEKKKKKDELKKKKQSIVAQDLFDDDEDGAISKQKHTIKETKPKKKSRFTQCVYDEGEDEDGSASKQKKLSAEKKKQASEEKKKKTQQNIIEDSDDGVPQRQGSMKKKNSKKSKNDISKSKIVQDEDEDEDGGRIVKTYDAIKKIIPSKQPILDNRIKKEESSSDDSEDGTMRSSKRQQDTTSTSYDTIGRIVTKVSDDVRNIKSKKTIDKHHYDAVPTEEERAVRAATTDSPALNSQTSCQNNLSFLRRMSYREAQQSSPPAVSQRPHNFSSLRGQQNKNNDDHSHNCEITNKGIKSGFINRIYSIIESIPSLSSHSSKQTIKEKNHTKVIDATPDIEEEKARIKRRKIARNRWYLAYTLIHNPDLFDLRKKVNDRLIYVRSQKSTLIDKQLFASVVTDQEPVATTIAPKFESLRERRIKANTTTSSEPQPPTALRLLSMPSIDDYPESPAERYVAMRSLMLYDANNQQPTILHSLSLSPTSTINMLQQGNFTPSLFQPIFTPNPSTSDYSRAATSPNANSSTLRMQITHDQRMQAWYKNEIEKPKKNRRRYYSYGPHSKPLSTNNDSAAVILIPTTVPTTANNDKIQREPITSSFQSRNTTA